jgi:hypothetical protein
MRALRFLVPVAAAALLAGCSQADARKAQAILEQAQQAQESVTSEHFAVKLSFSFDGKSAEIEMQGGGYLKGAAAGDFFMTLTGSVPGQARPLDIAVVKRGGEIRLRESGRTQTLPLAAAQQQLGVNLDLLSQFTELTRYVKDGAVSDADYHGRPADKLVGVLDTQALLSGAGGMSSDLFRMLGIKLGDIRVVLNVPRDTHLVESMLAEITIGAQDKSISMAMSLDVSGVNQPVEFPTL